MLHVLHFYATFYVYFSIFKYCCGLHCVCVCVCVWHVRRSTSFASQLIHVLCRAYAAVSQPDEASTPTATASALSRGKHTRLLCLVESRLSRFDSCGTAAASPTFRSALRHAAAVASKLLLLVVAHGAGRAKKNNKPKKEAKAKQRNPPQLGAPLRPRRNVGAGRQEGGSVLAEGVSLTTTNTCNVCSASAPPHGRWPTRRRRSRQRVDVNVNVSVGVNVTTTTARPPSLSVRGEVCRVLAALLPLLVLHVLQPVARPGSTFACFAYFGCVFYCCCLLPLPSSSSPSSSSLLRTRRRERAISVLCARFLFGEFRFWLFLFRIWLLAFCIFNFRCVQTSVWRFCIFDSRHLRGAINATR